MSASLIIDSSNPSGPPIISVKLAEFLNISANFVEENCWPFSESTKIGPVLVFFSSFLISSASCSLIVVGSSFSLKLLSFSSRMVILHVEESRFKYSASASRQ
ncbi:MAG: hypothetical protein A3J93_05035 [Candidatus Magasanikbacteria bacterium RIFOXYC2_FULL_42_28]|uniref:Uncharacterized protein n=1 Tax=Candidatus Magasanikbacteria bacterium RIFOXYC2_FULL_42_28 TaxID=1798704 RepID=A0A1F6NV72_9BACT|nr:MAG: hypothetical protein A3J93_05035 [Candidatus Magasanikbacteria bacterium RIFOXYC2_FULL_42_28]